MLWSMHPVAVAAVVSQVDFLAIIFTCFVIRRTTSLKSAVGFGIDDRSYEEPLRIRAPVTSYLPELNSFCKVYLVPFCKTGPLSSFRRTFIQAQYQTAFTLSHFCLGLGSLVVPILTGMLIDILNSYIYPLALVALLSNLSCLLLSILYCSRSTTLQAASPTSVVEENEEL